MVVILFFFVFPFITAMDNEVINESKKQLWINELSNIGFRPNSLMEKVHTLAITSASVKPRKTAEYYRVDFEHKKNLFLAIAQNSQECNASYSPVHRLQDEFEHALMELGGLFSTNMDIMHKAVLHKSILLMLACTVDRLLTNPNINQKFDEIKKRRIQGVLHDVSSLESFFALVLVKLDEMHPGDKK